MDRWLIRNNKKEAPTKEVDDKDAPNEEVGQKIIENVCKSKPIKNLQTSLKRKYAEEYLEYGFSYKDINDEQRPICILCNKILANESMKPAKLKRHLHTIHNDCINKPVEFFERRLKTLNEEKNVFTKYTTVSMKQLRASYEAAYMIAMAKKPDTIGEDLILPVTVKITEIILGKEYADQLKNIPIFNNAMTRRITEISNDLLEQLILRIKISPKYSIQLDETTDITNGKLFEW